MGKKQAQCDLPAFVVMIGWICKLGHNGGDGGFEIEQSAFIQDHGHGGGGDDFRERSEIEEVGSGCVRGSGIIGEAAESLVRDQFSGKRDGQCAGREGANGDRLFQNVESSAEAVILVCQIADQKSKVCGRRVDLSQSRY